MKKIISEILEFIFQLIIVLIPVTFIFSLLTCAYPKILVQVLSVIFFVMSVFVCGLRWKFSKFRQKWIILKLERFYLLFSIILYIQMIHVSLLFHETGGNFFFVEIAKLIFDSEYEIYSSFINSIPFCFIFLYAIKKISFNAEEISNRNGLDSITAEFFNIDKSIDNKTITKEEGAKRKRRVQDEMNFFAERSFNCRILFHCSVAFVSLTFIHLVSGIVIDMFIGSMAFRKAFFENTPAVIGTGFPFTVVYGLLALCEKKVNSAITI